jgi:hypothetical protein
MSLALIDVLLTGMTIMDVEDGYDGDGKATMIMTRTKMTTMIWPTWATT